MLVKFYTNAAMEIHAGPVKILCDPWFVPGAFDGSWWHFPRLSTVPENLVGYTHLYISHIHPDHCDPATLKRLKDKSIPVIILKRDGDAYVRNRMQKLGFQNFFELADGQTGEIAPGVKVTMYAAFGNNVFIKDAETPNVIDSSIVVEHDGQVIFNANDNIPSPSDCEAILNRHGKIDLALLPYCGVGPWPSSYRGLSVEERKKASVRKAEQYLSRLVANAEALKPRLVIPCAGQMILGGINSTANHTLGCAEPQDADRVLKEAGIPCEVLWECDTHDISTGIVSRAGNGPLGKRGISKAAYSAELSSERYPWEDEYFIRDTDWARRDLLKKLTLARERLAHYQVQQAYNVKANEWWVMLSIRELPKRLFGFEFRPGSEVQEFDEEEFVKSGRKFLMIDIPFSYLHYILTRQGFWNNAYHGCLVTWWRCPDDYLPDIQALLQFFHM